MGIIAGKTYAIEKNVQVRVVKVFSSKKVRSNAIVVAALAGVGGEGWREAHWEEG